MKKQIFILICWIFFPIGFPFLFLIHIFKPRLVNDTFSEPVVDNEFNSLDSIKPQNLKSNDNGPYVEEPNRQLTPTEIIEAMLFEVNSDICCGRSDRAVNTIRFYLKDEQTQNLSLNIYFKKEYHFDGDMLQITKLMLDLCNAKFRNATLSHMINLRPLHYKYEHLEELLLISDTAVLKLDSTPLLICYLAKEYDKLELFLRFGYSAHKIQCREYRYDYSKMDGDGTYFYNVKTFKPNSEFNNMMLYEVLEFENLLKYNKSVS
jgi:hypothetical protein